MNNSNDPCLFCVPHGVTRHNSLAYCTRDSYPVSPGHSLIIPYRHCASFFDLTSEEMSACMELSVRVPGIGVRIEDTYIITPDGHRVLTRIPYEENLLN